MKKTSIVHAIVQVVSSVSNEPLPANQEVRCGISPTDLRKIPHSLLADVEGGAYREVLRWSAEGQSDLIVMGGVRGRRTLDMLVFGSTTHHVIRAASCPVLIVHGETIPPQSPGIARGQRLGEPPSPSAYRA